MIFFYYLNLSAQGLKFSHLTIDNGLSSNRVYSVVHDRDGFFVGW